LPKERSWRRDVRSASVSVPGGEVARSAVAVASGRGRVGSEVDAAAPMAMRWTVETVGTAEMVETVGKAGTVGTVEKVDSCSGLCGTMLLFFFQAKRSRESRDSTRVNVPSKRVAVYTSVAVTRHSVRAQRKHLTLSVPHFFLPFFLSFSFLPLSFLAASILFASTDCCASFLFSAGFSTRLFRIPFMMV